MSSCIGSVCSVYNDSECQAFVCARVCGGTKLARYLARAVKSTRERKREVGAFYGIIGTACVASHAQSMLCRLLQRTRVTYLLHYVSKARSVSYTDRRVASGNVGECRGE